MAGVWPAVSRARSRGRGAPACWPPRRGATRAPRTSPGSDWRCGWPGPGASARAVPEAAGWAAAAGGAGDGPGPGRRAPRPQPGLAGGVATPSALLGARWQAAREPSTTWPTCLPAGTCAGCWPGVGPRTRRRTGRCGGPRPAGGAGSSRTRPSWPWRPARIPGPLVGVAGLLGADAWRVRAALGARRPRRRSVGGGARCRGVTQWSPPAWTASPWWPRLTRRPRRAVRRRRRRRRRARARPDDVGAGPARRAWERRGAGTPSRHVGSARAATPRTSTRRRSSGPATRAALAGEAELEEVRQTRGGRRRRGRRLRRLEPVCGASTPWPGGWPALGGGVVRLPGPPRRAAADAAAALPGTRLPAPGRHLRHRAVPRRQSVDRGRRGCTCSCSG